MCKTIVEPKQSVDVGRVVFTAQVKCLRFSSPIPSCSRSSKQLQQLGELFRWDASLA